MPPRTCGLAPPQQPALTSSGTTVKQRSRSTRSYTAPWQASSTTSCWSPRAWAQPPEPPSPVSEPWLPSPHPHGALPSPHAPHPTAADATDLISQVPVIPRVCCSPLHATSWSKLLSQLVFHFSSCHPMHEHFRDSTALGINPRPRQSLHSPAWSSCRLPPFIPPVYPGTCWAPRPQAHLSLSLQHLPPPAVGLPCGSRCISGSPTTHLVSYVCFPLCSQFTCPFSGSLPSSQVK